MKNRASALLKGIPVLTSMAKVKSMASIVKARLLVLSLPRNKKPSIASLPRKFQSLLVHQESRSNPEDLSKAMVLHSHGNRYGSDQNPIHTQSTEEDNEENGSGYDCDDDDDKYPDLTHCLFDSEDPDSAGSAIDLVKNSKGEAGRDFNSEDDIDQAADLFIRKFHKQMMIQKLNSFKQKKERMQRGA